jgi:hypothetical protein
MNPEPTPPPGDPCTKGLTPVQSFVSQAIRVQPGMPLEPRLGRPPRPVSNSPPPEEEATDGTTAS